MISYDKAEIKESLSTENIFELLQEWGGDPEYYNFGILARTICHNKPGEGSKKLYYYENSTLFRCYTGCDSYFDIFQLVMKVAYIQHNKVYDLNDAVRWIAQKFNIAGTYTEAPGERELDDWNKLANYDRIQSINQKEQVEEVILKEYPQNWVNNLNYSLKITPWLSEGITQEVINKAHIGYYLGGDQISIPHYDKNSRLIGVRGRTLCREEAELYGKYRPLRIGKNQFNHPIGMNLYGLNWSKDNINLLKKVIVFESEKSVLLYASYFGWENNISVACCGSNLSNYQFNLLLKAGAQEVIIAFDRQFKEIGDKEFQHLTTNLKKLNDKYKKDAIISFIFDKKKITGYKDSPIDKGPEIFSQLFKERIII